MYFKMFKDMLSQWRWHLRSANHQVIATSGEGYYNKQDCLNGIYLVMGTNGSTLIKD